MSKKKRTISKNAFSKAGRNIKYRGASRARRIDRTG
jgi:hypothetical protein